MKNEEKIHIGTVIRNARVFNFKNWAEGRMNMDNLLQDVVRLFELLNDREIDYLLVDGIAMLQYVEGRNTEDIDLIIAASSLKKLPEIQISGQETFFARGQFGDLRLDLLLTRNPLFKKVQDGYAATNIFMEREIPCATPEGLLLLKLYALPSLYRQGNFSRVGLYENDIATLLQEYQPDLAPLFKELKVHLSETDIRALDEIISEIQQRIERFRRGIGNNE